MKHNTIAIVLLLSHMNQIQCSFLPSLPSCQRKNTWKSLQSKTTTTTKKNEFNSFHPTPSEGYAIALMDKTAALTIIDSILYPHSEHDIRIETGDRAMGLSSPTAITKDDPRLSLTYKEFPLESFDFLLQRAQLLLLNRYIETPTKEEEDLQFRRIVAKQPNEEMLLKTRKRKHMIDLGSGCGRLCMYAALILERWTVHGIEISMGLHDIACVSLERGIEEGLFYESSSEDLGDATLYSNARIQFHHGPAQDYGSKVLSKADLIFAYSTAWPAPKFNIDVGAVVLGPEWSMMLAKYCKLGCVVITTDRILDPKYGWNVVEKIEVDNPELAGSVGYIHVLERKENIDC